MGLIIGVSHALPAIQIFEADQILVRTCHDLDIFKNSRAELFEGMLITF